MGLRSLSFSNDVNICAVSCHLFKDLYDKEKGPIKDLDFTVEMYENAAAGRIDMSKEFNLQGYIIGCRKNEKLVQSKRRKKLTHLMQSESEDSGGIAVAKVVDERDDYEKLLDDDELKFTISKFKETSRIWCEDFGVDLIEVIRSTLHLLSDRDDADVETAEETMRLNKVVSVVKDITVISPDIGEMLYVLLSADFSFDELFPERKVVGVSDNA